MPLFFHIQGQGWDATGTRALTSGSRAVVEAHCPHPSGVVSPWPCSPLGPPERREPGWDSASMGPVSREAAKEGREADSPGKLDTHKADQLPQHSMRTFRFAPKFPSQKRTQTAPCPGATLGHQLQPCYFTIVSQDELLLFITYQGQRSAQKWSI